MEQDHRHPTGDQPNPALPDGASPRQGHRTSLDDELPPADDPLVREQQDAAARDAAGIGGSPTPTDTTPERQPLYEAGEGEAEGFEQAERELGERASHGDERSSPEADAFTPEEESDRSTAVYGEPDEIDPTEVVEDPQEGDDDPGRGPGIAADR